MSTAIVWTGIVAAAILLAYLVWHVVDRERRVAIRNRAGKVVGWKRVVGPAGVPRSFELYRPTTNHRSTRRTPAHATVRTGRRRLGTR